MAVCEVCGNDSAHSFEIRIGGENHTFDSFECAIHAVAPVCSHCKCKVIGHGIEKGGHIYCCQHCADSFEGIGAKGLA